MCDDVQALIRDLATKSVACSPIEEQRWGSTTRVTLPGGGKIGIYQPKHPSPIMSPIISPIMGSPSPADRS